MDKPDDGFVSRRGKHVSTDSVDLASLSIDGAPQDTPPIGSPRVVRPRRQIRLRGKTLLILLVVIIGLPIALGEVLTWQYSGAVGSTATSFNAIVQGDVKKAQTNTNLTADDISQITSRVYSLSSQMCQGGFLDNVASLYSRANSAHQRCVTEQQHYSALAGSLRQYENEQRYLEQMQAAIKAAAGSSNDQFAVISSQLELWQGVSATLARLSPPTSMQPAHSDLLKQSRAITSGWSQLYEAYNDQNASAFDTAERKITAGYDAFRAVQPRFNAIVDTSQAAISTQYKLLQ